MKLLLDTHFAIWLADRPHLLTAADRRTLENARGGLTASAVSLWEVRLKWSSRSPSGKRKLSVDPGRLLQWLRDNDVDVIDLTAPVAVATLDPPLAHSDPFDELLLTQAQQGGYRLLTRDERLAAHPVALVPA